MVSLYKDWIHQCKTSEMNSGYTEYLVESRNNGVMDENLLNTYLHTGIVAVPDPNGDGFIDHLDSIGLTLEDLGFKSNEAFKLGNGFLVPVWSSSFELLFFISANPDRQKDPTYKGGKYINVFPSKYKEELSSMRIFGLENTAKALACGTMFVTEGVFDKERLESAGLPVCSTLGSQIGSYHERIFSRFQQIVYIGDNDVPGKKARTSFINKLPRTIIHKVPRCKDIDEYATKYPKDYKLFIDDLKKKYM